MTFAKIVTFDSNKTPNCTFVPKKHPKIAPLCCTYTLNRWSIITSLSFLISYVKYRRKLKHSFFGKNPLPSGQPFGLRLDILTFWNVAFCSCFVEASSARRALHVIRVLRNWGRRQVSNVTSSVLHSANLLGIAQAVHEIFVLLSPIAFFLQRDAGRIKCCSAFHILQYDNYNLKIQNHLRSF